MTLEWWAGIAPAQVPIECSGAQHTFRWENGTLRALDHADAEGERTLAALGGERCACIDVLDAWMRHLDDVRVLALASRGLADQLRWWFMPPGAMGGQQPVQARPVNVAPTRGQPQRLTTAMPLRGVAATGSTTSAVLHGRYNPLAAPGQPQLDEIATLLGLGGGIGDRLAASVAANWNAHLARDDDDARANHAALIAALFGRVLCTLREWLGEPALGLQLDMIGPEDGPVLEREDGAVRASLPFNWLVDVWVHGLAVILGRFTLGVVERQADQLTLLTIGPSLTDIRALRIEQLDT